MTYRILLIGLDQIQFEKEDDEHIQTVSDISDAPTLYDYDIIIIFSVGLKYYILAKDKKEEFEMFFLMGGVLLEFPVGYIPSEIFPIELPEVVSKEGECIIPTDKHPFSSIFKNIEFEWCWHLKRPYIEELTIGKNLPGCPISYEIKLDSGAKIFFLPGLKDYEKDLQKFIRDALNIIKSTYLPNKSKYIEKPDWINEYNVTNELFLKKQLAQVTHLLKKIELIKQVLYSYGEQLSYSTAILLTEMGLNSKWVERGRKHDIEIDLNETIGVVEVKGLKGYANVKDLRQLLDHYTEKVNEGKKVKGIFILNHFRSIEPKKRKEPFTEDAIRIAKQNGFCLLTTADLFELLNKSIKKDTDVPSIKEKILKTKGRIEI